MEKDTNTPSAKYRIDYLILMTLVVLAFISVGFAGTKLGNFAVAGTLILSGIEAYLILWHFMRLRSMNKIYSVMAGLVLVILVLLLIIAFKDPGV